MNTSRLVLVTGGCGFVGANLVPKLLAEGHRVRVLDNLSRGEEAFLGGCEADLRIGDIRSTEDLDAAMKGVDAVIHLAAYGSVVESVSNPIENFEINGRGTLNVLAAAQRTGVSKVVFASTGGAIIGNATPPVSEESPPRPVSPYGASKLVGEAYCNAFAGSFGLPTVMLRFANIYGPISAHKKGAITVFAKALIADEPFTIFGDGTATRDLLHVDDLCRGIIAAMEADLDPGTTMHLATGRETSVNEVATILKLAAGKPNHSIVYAPSRPAEVLRNFAQYDRANELIGFEPRVSLEKGLQDTWRWFAHLGEDAIAITATDS